MVARISVLFILYVYYFYYISNMKHTIVLVLLLALFSHTTYAGTGTQTGSGFYAGVSFTPGVGYRYLSENKSTRDMLVSSSEAIAERNSYETPSFYYAVGFKMGYHIRKFVDIETGVEYTSIAYQWKQSGLTVGSGYRPDLSYDSTMLGWARGKYGYHYLNIPVAFNFILGKQQVKAVISVGAACNVLVGQWQQSKYSIPGDISGSSYYTTTSIRSLNRFNLSPFIGVGADWYINNLVTLRVMPIASIQSLVIADAPIFERLYTAGINVSVLFGLPRGGTKQAAKQ